MDCCRVSAPVSFGRIHLIPLAAQLIELYARLDIELRLEDRLVDLTQEHIDIAVRIGQPRDSSAIMHKLADNRRILVAAPAYLNRHGRPQSLSELQNHHCLRYDDSTNSMATRRTGRQASDFMPRCRLRANSGGRSA